LKVVHLRKFQFGDEMNVMMRAKLTSPGRWRWVARSVSTVAMFFVALPFAFSQTNQVLVDCEVA